MKWNGQFFSAPKNTPLLVSPVTSHRNDIAPLSKTNFDLSRFLCGDNFSAFLLVTFHFTAAASQLSSHPISFAIFSCKLPPTVTISFVFFLYDTKQHKFHNSPKVYLPNACSFLPFCYLLFKQLTLQACSGTGKVHTPLHRHHHSYTKNMNIPLFPRQNVTLLFFRVFPLSISLPLPLIITCCVHFSLNFPRLSHTKH